VLGESGRHDVSTPAIRALDLRERAFRQAEVNHPPVIGVALAGDAPALHELLGNPARPAAADPEAGGELSHRALAVLVEVDRGPDGVRGRLLLVQASRCRGVRGGGFRRPARRMRRVEQFDQEATRVERLVARHSRLPGAGDAVVAGGGRLRFHGRQIIIPAKHMR